MKRPESVPEAIVRKCTAVLHLFSSVLIIPITGLVVISVVMRYVVKSPFAFTEEVVGLFLISMAFLGMAHVTLKDSHIKVTLLYDLASQTTRNWLRRAGLVITAGFFAWLGILAYDYMQTALDLSARTLGSRLLLWPWTAILPLSCAVSCLAALVAAVAPYAPEENEIAGGLH
ncbi:MAG: TRAP transporter small permease [Rhizobiaceae bacterium]|nr:TRAP transporter small permease [Rhizobiaceae bacterium]